MFPFSSAAHLRQFIDFELEDAATIRKKEQAIMAVRDQQVSYGVILASGHSRNASTTSALRAIGAGGKTLDIALFGQRYHNLIVRDKVLVLKLACFGLPKVCTARIAIFLF